MNVVFDFGGVLFEWRPHEFIGRLLPAHAPHEAAARALAADFFQGYRGDWGEFDRGTVEPDALARLIARRTGIAVADVARVIDSVPHELQPIAGSVELLFELHALQRPLYFLSNMPEPYARHLEETHDFLELFRGGVFSSRAKLIKPEPAIFEHAAREWRIEPCETLFIDDMAGNVEAARAAGWQGLVFTGPEDCAAELRRRGLLPGPPRAAGPEPA